MRKQREKTTEEIMALRKRIADLEREVAELKARPQFMFLPYVPQPQPSIVPLPFIQPGDPQPWSPNLPMVTYCDNVPAPSTVTYCTASH